MSDDPTPGELSRRLDRAEADCERRAARHVDSDLYAAERRSTDIQLADLRADLSQMEDRLRWAWRTAITSLVAPVVVGIVLAVLTLGVPS